MESVTYVGKVLSDGHLSLPKKAREELQLNPGQEVEVVLRVLDRPEELPDEAFEPLRKLIGLAKKGKPDGAARHDRYLYGKKDG